MDDFHFKLRQILDVIPIGWKGKIANEIEAGYNTFSATTYHSRPKACKNSERSNFAQKILERVISGQKMAVESKNIGFRDIYVAQMC